MRYAYPLIAMLVGAMATPTAMAGFMFQAKVDGKIIEGEAIDWSARHMLVYGRDGQLHHFDPRKATEGKKTGTSFSTYSLKELREQLRSEFGSGYAVTSTGHYLVVHPVGVGDNWASRFEELYRSFGQYFRVRGFRLKAPKVPLVAVVFPDQREYRRQMAATKVSLPDGTLGHYDPQTNRVLMFDQSSGGEAGDWSATSSTIIHEATHQTAYNVGLHNRTAVAPRWVIEGLAMMFEARGVYNSAAFDSRADRYNHERLRDFHYFAKDKGAQGTLIELVASDMPFRTNTVKAYSGAWALTFYLSETRPRDYEKYLSLTASRPALVDYSQQQRVRDFASVFGTDFQQFEADWLRWMAKLE